MTLLKNRQDNTAIADKLFNEKATWQHKLEWAVITGQNIPPRQPIQTPQEMRAKPFYLTAQASTGGQTDRLIPVYPPNFVVGVK